MQLFFSVVAEFVGEDSIIALHDSLGEDVVEFAMSHAKRGVLVTSNNRIAPYNQPRQAMVDRSSPSLPHHGIILHRSDSKLP